MRRLKINTNEGNVGFRIATTDFVDKQIIGISAQGEIALNDGAFDLVKSMDLPQLKNTLMGLKQSGDAVQSSVLFITVSEDE